MTRPSFRFSMIVAVLLLTSLAVPRSQTHGQSEVTAKDNEADVRAGHSTHGETFNEGPRQAAYLMEGMGNVKFEVSTSQPETQKFFTQGVAQLHGFWYFEAERSFRQAAKFDPNCAMCYWGMSLANVNNRKRAEGFINEAVKHKANASPREQMYIEAARRRFQEPSDGKKLSKKDIAQNYTRDLEEIVLKYPEDLEARAFLALQLWENERNDLPIVSHLAINGVLEDVFDKNPMHPAHHYRIHLWDKRQPSQALRSAALCGPSLPGIAHMWHMPGHTYSNLHRYADAVWQQEASARVDHAHMMRDRIMPDQIHNFAHNNEWMIRNLLKIGRIQDAVRLASNMIQLPRHPKFNTLKGGSAKYGRERLLQSLSGYRLWPELLSALQANLIEPGETEASQIEWTRYLGIAHAMLGNANETTAALGELQERLQKTEKSLAELNAPEKPASPIQLAARPDEGMPPSPTAGRSPTAPATPAAPASNCQESSQTKNASGDAADTKKADANRQRREREKNDRKKELETVKTQLTQAIAAIEACRAAQQEQWNSAVSQFDKAGSWDKLLKAEWLTKADKVDEALKLAQSQVKENPASILPLATLTWVHWQSRGPKEAREDFEKLREACAHSDMNTPLLARFAPLAAELGVGEKWNKPPQAASDTGVRPALDSLGPFEYSPYQAPAWQASQRDSEVVDSQKYAGKPHLVIFYLGFGCLHCIEQLQEFSPKVDQLREAGLDIVAISTESPELLAKGMDNYAKPLNIPLVADPSLKAFKAFRCYDDFENQPLHGTFLIDGQGRVLWQDISFEPFKDVSFLTKEAKRLLALPK